MLTKPVKSMFVEIFYLSTVLLSIPYIEMQVPLIKSPVTLVKWCATRQVDNLNNENYFLPGTILYRVCLCNFFKFLFMKFHWCENT